MEPRVRKLWSGLVLGFVMAVPGATNAPSLAAMAGPPVAAGVIVRPLEPARPIAVAARQQLPGNGASGGWSRLPATGIGPAWSGERTKTYALVLSLVGMVGMVVWHRLARSF